MSFFDLVSGLRNVDLERTGAKIELYPRFLSNPSWPPIEPKVGLLGRLFEHLEQQSSDHLHIKSGQHQGIHVE